MLVHSWRWFGPKDPISLDQIVQTGAEGVVSALHDVPTGEPWRREDIRDRKKLIQDAGLTWSAVESLPVHEDIKKGSGNYLEYIENYKQTLRGLGQEGIPVVSYNFIPALDWLRTDQGHRLEDGARTSGFNYVIFAAIDIHILERPDADKSYPDHICKRAGEYFEGLDDDSRARLEETFLLGFPGSGDSFSTEEVRRRIKSYDGLTKERFRQNLVFFLEQVVPVAEEEGIRLAIHPDDPPLPLLGIPRIMSTLEDARFVIRAVDSPVNGITFCTGSFGAVYSNDVQDMVRKLAHRINFAHLRNISRDRSLNFQEKHFFGGDLDMYTILKLIIREDVRREKEEGQSRGIPVRPDHSAQILGDFKASTYPGYPLYGRMKSLAEIRGLETGIRRSLEEYTQTNLST